MDVIWRHHAVAALAERKLQGIAHDVQRRNHQVRFVLHGLVEILDRLARLATLGLALAVYVAKTTSLEHAFWVVLGALAVLRSSALGTGATGAFGAAVGLVMTVTI